MTAKLKDIKPGDALPVSGHEEWSTEFIHGMPHVVRRVAAVEGHAWNLGTLPQMIAAKRAEVEMAQAELAAMLAAAQKSVELSVSPPEGLPIVVTPLPGEARDPVTEPAPEPKEEKKEKG